ncbi:MAG: hypothetical protein ACP5QB_13935, partial [Thiomonas sp.]
FTNHTGLQQSGSATVPTTKSAHPISGIAGPQIEPTAKQKSSLVLSFKKERLGFLCWRSCCPSAKGA